MRKLKIDEMRQLAINRKGKCLTLNYGGAFAKLDWQCSKGHIWKATPNHIKNDKGWCPICSRDKLKLTINEMRKIATQRGGKCLSDEYINSGANLAWQCAKGHTWDATPNSVKGGTWCPKCAGKVRLTINQMEILAGSRDGKCLSQNYINSATPLKWQCSKGHIWKARPNDIQTGKWCPKCGGTEKLTIQEMQNIAKERGGRCLSQTYLNGVTPLKWQCSEGHTWRATPAAVKKKEWCPRCSNGISERVCRGYFESIFGKKFPTIRPNWLLNNRGNRMELDGYCKIIRLAFEYQGKQHFEFEQFFHKNKKLEDRISDDQLKAKLCNEKKITLIIVPYTIDLDKMDDFIVKECEKYGFKINDYKKISLQDLNVYSRGKMEVINEAAKKRGGSCLSKTYIDRNTKLSFKCSKGHIWGARPEDIIRGHWCPNCGWRTSSIEEMQQIAKSKGGKCLSDKYINKRTSLRWQCSEGHEWDTKPGNIRRGTWCPVCARKKSMKLLPRIS